MSEQRCQVCGAPRSTWLDGNCPGCLLGLGIGPDRDPEIPEGKPPRNDSQRARPKYLGAYELLEVIAQGGVGVVYRARHLDLQRLVAVKVLLAGQFATDASLLRFRREAEAAARLSHPNIIPIYEVGEQDGQPFFSMELIEGRNLTALVREKPLAGREAAQILTAIAGALQYAHERGILHRDLKPSNVILDDRDVPHVTDFGFAKRLGPREGSAEETERLTVSGEVFGTPNYMSPEQANPRLGPATVATDVYSLGAILYQLLTARPPFLADSITETLRLAAESEPVSPRILNPSVPQDLETICLKCLEKNPRQRYGSARELADELDRYLAGEPIHARRSGPADRFFKWCRRKPALARALGAAILFLLLILVGLPVALIRINNAREAAVASNRNYRQELYSALLGRAESTVLSAEIGHRELALDALKRAAEITNAPELRRVAMTAFTLPDLRLEREGPPGPTYKQAELDPSFSTIAHCIGDGPIELHSAADGKLIKSLPGTGGDCNVIRWDSSGQYLAARRDSLPRNSSVEIWDVKAGNLVFNFHESDFRFISFAPGRPRLIGLRPDGGAVIWDVDQHREFSSFRLPYREIPGFDPFKARGLFTASAVFSSDGERIAIGHPVRDDHMLGIYRCSDGALLQSFTFTNRLTDIDWSSDGRWLGATDWEGNAHLVDLETTIVHPLGRHKAQAATAQFSPDGNYLFTGGWEREIHCWEVQSQKLAFTIPRDSFMIEFANNGSNCVLVRPTGPQYFNFEPPAAHKEFSVEIGRPPFKATFSPDSRFLAVSDSSSLHVWDLKGGPNGASLPDGAVSNPAFSDLGELYASGREGLYRWRILPGRKRSDAPVAESLPFPNLPGMISLCVSKAGVAINSTNGTQLIPPDRPGILGNDWKRTSWGISDMSPDGRFVTIYAPYSKVLHVYSLPGLERAANLTNQLPISKVTFPQGSSGLAVCTRKRIEFWDTATWRKIREVPDSMEYIVSPKSGAVWLMRDFSSAGLYDSTSLQSLLPLPKGTSPLALSPDERWLAVSAGDGKVQVWDLIEVRRRLGELGLDWKVR